jgi:hypothetical protein
MVMANTSGKTEVIIKAISSKDSETALVFGRKIISLTVNLTEVITY